MKISQTADCLSIDYPQYLLKAVGMLFFIVGLALLAFLLFMPTHIIAYQLWHYLFPGLFAGTGFHLMASTDHVHVAFNKSTQVVEWQRQNLFHRSTQKIPLTEIHGVMIQQRDKLGQPILFRVVLKQNNGRELPLIETYDQQLAGQVTVVKTICAFLNLTPEVTQYETQVKKVKNKAFAFALLGFFSVMAIVIVKFLPYK